MTRSVLAHTAVLCQRCGSPYKPQGNRCVSCDNVRLDEREKAKILDEFIVKLTQDMEDLDPEIVKLVDKHFWELF